MNDAIEGKNIMVIGRRRPFLNSKTDTVKMQKYEEQFKKLQEEYTSTSRKHNVKLHCVFY